MLMLAYADVLIVILVSEMTTKFNQEMYAQIRARKNERLSCVGLKRSRVTKEAVETTLSISVAPESRVASPVIWLEEISPRPKRTRGSEKGKSKADASVWYDATTALGKAHNVITSSELKCLLEIPSHELVNHHIDKLVLVFFV